MLAIDGAEVRVVVRQPNYRRGERAPACALVFGEVADGALVRIHSRCLYGDVFGSQECDCAGQLHHAMELMRRRGGVLIYLDQEGRGAGLFAKARAYRMRQERGLDSFRSYEHYGYEPDPRRYTIAAELLEDLKLERVTLLTNNPDKVAGLEAHGIAVDRQPLVVPVSERAVPYLESKRARGHQFDAIPQLETQLGARPQAQPSG
ncbi:MAG TPA: GTP cyclohydrolase II [Acidimicrobiales bacterium]